MSIFQLEIHALFRPAFTLTDSFAPFLLAMMDRGDTMKVLIRLGADVNEPNNTGSTPLHAASLNGYGPSMELLVAKGARIDAKNIYDYSPVNYADSNSRGHSPIYNHVNTVEYVLHTHF